MNDPIKTEGHGMDIFLDRSRDNNEENDLREGRDTALGFRERKKPESRQNKMV